MIWGMVDPLFGAATFSPSAADLGGAPPRVTLRPGQVLTACRSALGVVRAASGKQVLLIGGLELVGTVAIVAQVLIARSFLARLVTTRGVTPHLGSALPFLVAAAAVTAVAALCQSVAQERQFLLAELTARAVEERILATAASVALAAFDDPDFHDGLQRAQVNASVRPYQLATGLVSFTTGALGVIGLGVALLALQALVLPLVVLAFVPLLAVALRNARARYRSSYALAPRDRARRYLAEVLIDQDVAAELRILGATGWLRHRHAELFEDRIGRVRAVVAERERRSMAAVLAMSGVLLLAMLGLVELTVTKHMSLATAGAATLAVLEMLARLRSLSQGVSLLYEGSLFLHDLELFLARAPSEAVEPVEPTPEVRGASSLGRVRLEGVGFTYPGAPMPALVGVSLEIGRGEIVALVGANGSGKTTVGKLVCGLYPPTTGAIGWHGEDSRALSPTDVASQVAWMPQSFGRFQLSARANVALGDHRRGEALDEVRRAGAWAEVDELLAGLPDGYETPLTRAFGGGSELSSGQWQRVALARALFRDASLLVLDEPTSALDPETESRLLARIRQLCQDRAVLLISHRLPVARLADRVHVLSKGRVIESGDHDGLMRLGGHYARLFEIQALGYQMEESPR